MRRILDLGGPIPVSLKATSLLFLFFEADLSKAFSASFRRARASDLAID